MSMARLSGKMATRAYPGAHFRNGFLVACGFAMNMVLKPAAIPNVPDRSYKLECEHCLWRVASFLTHPLYQRKLSFGPLAQPAAGVAP